MMLRRLITARRQRGFSLIEVAVSVGILTVGLLGVLLLLVVQLKDQSSSSAQSRALDRAQQEIDHIRRLSPSRVALREAAWTDLSTSPEQSQAMADWTSNTRATPEDQLALAAGAIEPSSSDGGMSILVSVVCDPLAAGQDEGAIIDCADDLDGSVFDRTVTVVVAPRGSGPAARLVTRVNAVQASTADAPAGGAGTGEGVDPDTIQLSQIDHELDEERGVYVIWGPVDGATSYTLTLDGEDKGPTTETSVLISVPEFATSRAGGQVEVCITAHFASGVAPAPSCEQMIVKPSAPVRTDLPGTGVNLTWQASPVSDPLMAGYQVLAADGSGEFAVISGEDPIAVGDFTDPDGTCADTYLVRAIPADPPELGEGEEAEGHQYATRDVVPACGG